MNGLLWCDLIALFPLGYVLAVAVWDEIVYMANMEEW
jgi:hypothetical protein